MRYSPPARGACRALSRSPLALASRLRTPAPGPRGRTRTRLCGRRARRSRRSRDRRTRSATFDGRSGSVAGGGPRHPRAGAAQRHHERQDPRDRHVELGRDLVVDVADPVEQPGQRLVLDDRDAVLAGPLADLRRQRVRALRHDPRGAPAGLVAQGHRVVRGVDEDDVGGRDGGEHPVAAHRDLPRPDRALDHRVALGLPVSRP